MFVITALRSVYGRTNYQRLLVRPIFDLFFIFDNINIVIRNLQNSEHCFYTKSCDTQQVCECFISVTLIIEMQRMGYISISFLSLQEHLIRLFSNPISHQFRLFFYRQNRIQIYVEPNLKQHVHISGQHVHVRYPYSCAQLLPYMFVEVII